MKTPCTQISLEQGKRFLNEQKDQRRTRNYMILLNKDEKDFLKKIEEKGPSAYKLLKDHPAGLRTYFKICQLLEEEEIKAILATETKHYVFPEFEHFARTDPDDFRKFIAINTVLFEAVNVFPVELSLFAKAMVMPESERQIGRHATLLISQDIFLPINQNIQSALITYLSRILANQIAGVIYSTQSTSSVVFTLSIDIDALFSQVIQNFNAEFDKLLQIILREGCRKLKNAITFSDYLVKQTEDIKECLLSTSFKKYSFSRMENTIHFYTLEKKGNIKEELLTDFTAFVEKLNGINLNLHKNKLRRYRKEIKQYFKTLIDKGALAKAESYVKAAKEFGFDEYQWDLIETVCESNSKNDFGPWLHDSCLAFPKESPYFERAQHICSELLCDSDAKINKPTEKLRALEMAFVLLHNSKNINDNQLRARECFIELCGFPMLSHPELYVVAASTEQRLVIAQKFRELNKKIASLEQRDKTHKNNGYPTDDSKFDGTSLKLTFLEEAKHKTASHKETEPDIEPINPSTNTQALKTNDIPPCFRL